MTLRTSQLPDHLRQDIETSIDKGYTETRYSILGNKIICRKPQSILLHIALFAFTFGLGNLIYVALNRLNADTYKT